MISLSFKSLLVDSGYWIALFDARDGRHLLANDLKETIFNNRVLIPFPCIYEFLGTRFSRKLVVISEIERTFMGNRVELVPDEPYRKSIIDRYIASSKTGRDLSAVDIIINDMLEDTNLRVNGLVTFNIKDFAKTCRKRSIEMISQ